MTSDVAPPYFPATVPPAFTDPPEAVAGLVAPVLDDLAEVVAGSRDADPAAPTPCEKYDVAALRDHVLGWLQFFAAALADPQRQAPRPDPDGYRAADDERDLAGVVRQAGATITGAIRSGATGEQVVLSASRMDGPAAVAMILGEYVLHGWDLARATGRPWAPAAPASEAALEFFRGMILPEYRGGDAGYFGPEIAVPPGAPALDRLLGFAGRDPGWTAGEEKVNE